MSCKAQRYNNRRGCRGPLVKHKINDQQIVERFMKTDVLMRIFGLTSVEKALRVALRIKKAKQRTPAIFSQVHTNSNFECHRHLKGRNNHHLTPRSRKDQPYYGDTPHNLLLIKIKRHDALHEECEVRTWEEIIFLLARCVQKIRGISLKNIIDRVSPIPRRKKKHHHTARYRSHSRSRSFGPG